VACLKDDRVEISSVEIASVAPVGKGIHPARFR